jgi:hypothetical protein
MDKKNAFFGANNSPRDFKNPEITLPPEEYLEFLSDLRDCIQLNKDNLMVKMSSYLAKKIS